MLFKVLKAATSRIKASRRISQLSGVGSSVLDSWHVLRFEVKEGGGPLAFSQQVMEDLKHMGGTPAMGLAVLWLLYCTPYGVTAFAASQLSDDWFSGIDSALREQMYEDILSRSNLRDWVVDPSTNH